MLSRWFFYQTAEEAGRERIAAQVAGMPCLGRVPLVDQPTHFFLSEKKNLSIIIGLSYEGWKLDEKNWWRGDILAIAPQILMGEKIIRRQDEMTYLVWSRDEGLMPIEGTPRAVAEEQAKMEAACLWGWIQHVCRQTVREQHEGGIRYGFETWLKNATLTLPKPIRLRRPSSYR